MKSKIIQENIAIQSEIRKLADIRWGCTVAFTGSVKYENGEWFFTHPTTKNDYKVVGTAQGSLVLRKEK